MTCDIGEFLPILRQIMLQEGFTEQSFLHKPSLYISPDTPLIQKLRTVYEQCTGQDGSPRCIGGGTYAKVMPNLVAFGPNFPGDDSRIHRPNEYMDLAKLERHTMINAMAMYELAK